MTKKKTAPEDPVCTEEIGTKTAADLFKEIVDYKFTETEAQRKAAWQKSDGKTVLPIVDDEYISICGELEEITAQRKEKESRYAEAIEEFSASRGLVPFELYRKTEEECYSLSELVEDLKKKERALQDQKAQYERKADVLLNEYQQAKTAEAKQYILDHVKDLREYAVAVRDEMAQAEAITLARKEMVPADIALPVPFGGDTIRQVVHFFDEIIQVTERYL